MRRPSVMDWRYIIGVLTILMLTACGTSPTSSSATPDPGACRRTSLYWGVEPVLVDSLDPGIKNARTRLLAKEAGLASEGDFILEVRGFHADPELNVPTLSICKI